MALCASCRSPLQAGFSRCPVCLGYTTVETGAINVANLSNVVSLDQVVGAEVPRLHLGEPFDSVWGGGIVPTTTTMLAATAGCGKTTMMLQLSDVLIELTKKYAYYMSAEQPAPEIKLMAERLGLKNLPNIKVLKEYGSGAEIDPKLLKEFPPCLFVVDSVTDMCGRDDKLQLVIVKNYKKLAVAHGAPAVLISHMNKAGDTAGLYRMHHTVDTLIALGNLLAEPPREINKFLDQGYSESILDTNGEDLKCICAFKNRHGPTGKDHYLFMGPHGLVPLAPPPPKPKKLRGRPPLDKEAREARIALLQDPLPKDRATVDQVRKTVKEIEHNGQKLVNRKTAKPARAAAVEGEALKTPRPAMPRTKQGRDEAKKRMKARKKQQRKKGKK